MTPYQSNALWIRSIEAGSIGFRLDLEDKPLTRCRIPSTVSLVYDALGVFALVILVAKQPLREMCIDGIDWIDPVPDHIRLQWKKWRSELPLLEKIKIPRYVKPPNFGESGATEQHSNHCQ